jgi:hypothetical protein
MQVTTAKKTAIFIAARLSVGSMVKPQTSQDQPSPNGNNYLSYKALFFMTMLSLQFGIQPIVTQKFMSKKIIMSTVIFTQEVLKLIIGVVGISLGKTRWADVASGELVVRPRPF